MKYFDVCTRREYEVNGEKKQQWLRCGTMRVNEKGNKFIELNHLHNTTFYVFEQKERVAPKQELKAKTPVEIAWEE